MFRYYMAPIGLIAVDELLPGWGLLEVQGRRVLVTAMAEKQERCANYEMGMLVSECRKIQIAESGQPLFDGRRARAVERAVRWKQMPEYMI